MQLREQRDSALQRSFVSAHFLPSLKVGRKVLSVLSSCKKKEVRQLSHHRDKGWQRSMCSRSMSLSYLCPFSVSLVPQNGSSSRWKVKIQAY